MTRLHRIAEAVIYGTLAALVVTYVALRILAGTP